MNDVDPVTGTAAGAAVRSPQQRRLAALSVEDGDAVYRTVCRAEISGPVPAAGRVAAAVWPAIAELFTIVGHPLPDAGLVVRDNGSEPPGAPWLAITPTAAGAEVVLALPAACADETTAVDLLRTALGGVEAEPALPHDVAARWWDGDAGSP